MTDPKKPFFGPVADALKKAGPVADAGRKALNDVFNTTPSPGAEGLSLQSADHPLLITDAMLDAGYMAREANLSAGGSSVDMLKAIYTAMVRAGPPEPEDLNEESLEHALVEIGLHKETIEDFAYRLAGIDADDGDVWPTLSDKQKDVWRQFVRELAAEIFDAPRQMRLIRGQDDGKAKDD